MKAGTKVALSAASRRSHAQANESPAPAAGPLTAASTGFSSARTARIVRVVVPAQPAGDVLRGLAELVQVLADAEAATRAGDDDRAHVVGPGLLERAHQRLCSSAVNALRTSGRLSVIVRTPPSRLVSTSAIRRSLQPGC